MTPNFASAMRMKIRMGSFLKLATQISKTKARA
jgi:hypothetical protein